MKEDSNITGLAHICIYTKNLEESLRFYERHLDFEMTYRTVVGREKQDGFFPLQYILIRRGSCIIELLQPADTDKVEVGAKGIVDHFALEVKNIEKVFERLKAAGVVDEADKIFHFPDLFDGSRAFFIKGPSGEGIELFEYL